MSSHGGCVINIGSVGATSFNGPLGVYHASKATLEYITRHLATELGPNVRVNLIAPGLIKTNFSSAIWQGEEERDQYPWPMRRIGLPVDVANAALFLASELAGWITGQVLVVDGGASSARA
jgi:NAD(P)-dependent dehydrogenase (short-subunit alcohol dehydrogenase family)